MCHRKQGEKPLTNLTFHNRNAIKFYLETKAKEKLLRSPTFGEPEVRFSSVGPALVMPMIIGYKKARELLYFGDTIDAKTALELGMVNRVVPLAELWRRDNRLGAAPWRTRSLR